MFSDSVLCLAIIKILGPPRGIGARHDSAAFMHDAISAEKITAMEDLANIAGRLRLQITVSQRSPHGWDTR